MKSWIILYELVFSIMFLTAFYLYSYYYSYSFDMLEYKKYNYEELLLYDKNCNIKDSIYEIINISNNNITYCYFGNRTNKLENFKPIYQYLFAGNKSYDPYILIIYK